MCLLSYFLGILLFFPLMFLNNLSLSNNRSYILLKPPSQRCHILSISENLFIFIPKVCVLEMHPCCSTIINNLIFVVIYMETHLAKVKIFYLFHKLCFILYFGELVNPYIKWDWRVHSLLLFEREVTNYINV